MFEEDKNKRGIGTSYLKSGADIGRIGKSQNVFETIVPCFWQRIFTGQTIEAKQQNLQ